MRGMSELHITTSAQMPLCDSLGRCREAIIAPAASSWVLPHSAYRLLLDFLRCERTFCNKVVPTFHPFGWVTLRAAHAKESQEGERMGKIDIGEERSYHGRRRLRNSSALALPQKQNPHERDE